MDSNTGYRINAQLEWLDSILNLTCTDTVIDFVFVQFHHPHKSELWLPGELDYSGQVVAKMEAFSTNCGKPSIHFFGHTHGYSRGQSRDHDHLWVNVATAGGRIDYWGAYPQADYEEFVITQDEYGFVMVEVTAGADPTFTMRRISTGDEFTPKNNTLEDEVIVRVNNTMPDRPIALFPLRSDTLAPDCIAMKADEFIDPDGDGHGASHWQIALDSTAFGVPVYDQWKQHKNWYFDVNTQIGDDLTDEQVLSLEPETTYWWRVRYRDKSLAWSEWSIPEPFRTSASQSSGNLILNAAAENGTSQWNVQTGVLESLSAGECNGINPYSGSRYFAIGALCVEHPFASAYQDMDVSAWSAKIDSGMASAVFGAYMADWNGSDEPAFALQCLDSLGTVLAGSDTTAFRQPTWTQVLDSIVVPPMTRQLRFIMMGTRYAGTDNDSYLDDILSKLIFSDTPCARYSAAGPLHGRYYVDQDAPGLPTGESWTKAFKTVESALTAADTNTHIHELWIAEGTYFPTPNNDRSRSFFIENGLALYGGFSGNEQELSERNPSLYFSILSGDIGQQQIPEDNSYHVVRVENLSDTLLLDGLRITGGKADDAPESVGGGLFIPSPFAGLIFLKNCRIENNLAASGSAIYNQGNVTIKDCFFTGNNGIQIVNDVNGNLEKKGTTLIEY